VSELVEHLRRTLPGLPHAQGVAVALSGGGDSTALLHALALLREPLGLRLRAVHVHHGLLPEADGWAERCADLCRGLAVPLTVLRVRVPEGDREGPEAAARSARYEALGGALEADELCLTAHHREDQAETFLIQALRGAGPAGLAAMPALRRLGRGWLARPLLALPRAVLRTHLAAHGLEWVEDPMNRDPRLLRARVRLDILPVLEATRPGAAAALARAAAHCAEVTSLLEGLAELDLAGARGSRPGTLSAPALRALAPPRARNLLRHWLRRQGLPVPGTAQLEAALAMLLGSRRDAAPVFRWPGGELRRHRDALYALPPLPPARLAPRHWDLHAPLELPELGGILRAEPATGAGLLDPMRVPRGVTVRLRAGGERCRPAGAGLTRPLKKLLQESGLAPWERARLPLLLDGERLVAVPGLAVCASHATVEAGQAGLHLVWEAGWMAPPGAASR